MRRHITAGMLGAAFGVMAWLIAAVAIPIAMVVTRVSLDNTGAAGFGVSVDTGSLTLAVVAGFGLGYYWSTRRVRGQAQPGRREQR
jgi:high-affinity Fe2+/Pb2+ permease